MNRYTVLPELPPENIGDSAIINVINSCNSPYGDSDIDIKDEFVPIELRKKLIKFLYSPIWSFGWQSVQGVGQFSFWHAKIAGKGRDSRESCEGEFLNSEVTAPVAQLWELLRNGPLKRHEPLRIYANAHTYGVEGYPHTDSHEDNYFTTIYYGHIRWSLAWGGELLFYHHNQPEIIKAIVPRPGRLVFFPGRALHCAKSPSRDCNALRISLVIKSRIAG